MPFESATTSSIRASQMTECNNVACPAAGEITIRQPQAHLADLARLLDSCTLQD
jgi:hypothetical protein